MIKFMVATVECYEEDAVLTVALGDDAFDPQNFIIISRLDDEDNETVDQCIGLQTGKSQYEAADAIKSVVLNQDYLEVLVKPEFVDHFGEAKIVGEFPLGDGVTKDEISKLRTYLSKIFTGSQVVLLL